MWKVDGSSQVTANNWMLANSPSNSGDAVTTLKRQIGDEKRKLPP